MKQYGKYLVITGLIILGMFLSYLSASAWGRMVQQKDSVMFYLKQPIALEDALAVAEQNKETAEEYRQEQEEKKPPLSFCIWGQKEDVMLSNENLSRSFMADVILLCGSPELLFEDCRVPMQEDSAGCLVDEKAAWELFGDMKVVGKEISYEGNDYTIRNVVPGKEGIVAFQASRALIEKNTKLEGAQSNESMDGVMQRLTMHKPKGYSVYDLESSWNHAYGFFVDVLDLQLLRGIGGIVMLLFPVSLCFLFGCYLYHLRASLNISSGLFGHFTVKKNGKLLQGKAAAVGLSLMLMGLLLFFLKDMVQIPDDYIPTRWSEFSFWTRLWEIKTEAVKLLLGMPKTVLDSHWMGDFFQTLTGGFLAEALLVVAGFLAQLLKERKT